MKSLILWDSPKKENDPWLKDPQKYSNRKRVPKKSESIGSATYCNKKHLSSGFNAQHECIHEGAVWC